VRRNCWRRDNDEPLASCFSHGEVSMVSFRIVIIDDDRRACEILRHHLQRVAPEAQIVAELYDISSAQLRLVENDYDVVFLDVQLLDGDGFDLVPFVDPEAAIIFVTARDDHAVRAFEVNAVDYIVKPIKEERLMQALRRVRQSGRQRVQTVRRYKSTDHIFLRGAAAGGRFVPVAEITAIMSSENYTEVLLACGERWFVRQTMCSWEESLPSEMFLRVHRTAIVNLHRIERVDRSGTENTSLRLHGVRNSMPVGRRMWAQLKAQLEKRRPL
jgi:two-component system, LytTR family, response regulator